MQQAAKILEYGLLAWFGALALVLALRMLRRNITVSGMLMTEARRGAGMAPERVLNMAAFPVVLIYFVQAGLHVDVAAALELGVRPSLPNIPDNLVALLTGTNSLYLAGKIARTPS